MFSLLGSYDGFYSQDMGLEIWTQVNDLISIPNSAEGWGKCLLYKSDRVVTTKSPPPPSHPLPNPLNKNHTNLLKRRNPLSGTPKY